jgi:hypothetical protein
VPTPAHARLGAEGVERLRARYAEILARISERADDAVRREELKLQADRLNPDSWVTDTEVTQGLEQYESVFASLREVIGQKRRRRRRGNRPRPGEISGFGAPATDSPGDTIEGEARSGEEEVRSGELADGVGDEPEGGQPPDES